MSTRAIVVRDDGGEVRAGVQQVELAGPGKGETLLAVTHSSLNYKDAMAVAGRPGILRGLPMVPGIDAVGRTPDGRSLVVTGAGLGERRHGGLAEQVVIEHATAVPVPEAYTPRQAAAIGTAGVTAALAALALRRHGAPDGPVLVTGAGGGVGGYAVALLSALGHRVVASTGRREALEEHLTGLGAAEVVDRLDPAPGRPLQQQRWAAVVDAVGGGPLVNAIAQTVPGGVVAACGLAASPDLPGTVLPFILRGVVLAGVDSVAIGQDARREAWALLVAHVPGDVVDRLTEREIGLGEVAAAADEVLAGRIRGRVVVDVRR
ncbi:acryloyl-CoA reductase [Amnibacterium sp. CER49]|uniref:acrylyl-CoA reductase family protein n=1 Tax=Amnibacterium sp. CER49 TaxID=3039161 RepID=UPI0024496A76|nr:acryloyl-CoA reductase [Amnibacterium sp. CER49]MDH2443572.1 acryloyl-CoA reductase [Amnibacterium sp. CER49]